VRIREREREREGEGKSQRDREKEMERKSRVWAAQVLNLGAAKNGAQAWIQLFASFCTSFSIKLIHSTGEVQSDQN